LTESELRDLEYLSKWASRKYKLPWQEIQSEAFIRFYKYNYRVMSACVAHACNAMIWDLVRNKHLEVGAFFPEGAEIDTYEVEWVDEFRTLTKGVSKADRDALFLFVLGHSHKEIAATLNTTEMASRKRVSRAKQRIRTKAR